MFLNVLDLEDSLLSKENSVKFSPSSPERALFNPKMQSTMRPPLSFRVLPKMMKLMNPMRSNMKLSLESIEENPIHPKTQVDDEFIAELEKFALEIGIDEVGYTELSREFIFQDKAVLYGKGVIVLSLEMDFNKMELAPSPQTHAMILGTYNKLGILANKMADFLRDNGYGAQAGHPLGGLTVYPPLGQMAGMGWHGLNGLLITPKFGPRHRLAAIYTSIENLPIPEENQHSWVEDFCNKCKKCVKECPGKAILGKPIIHGNGSRTYIETEKCMPQFLNNHGCSICIKVCEFNRKDYYKIKESFLNSNV